jgi:predicted regulator of Ras-like GTPase activity (Roadblock/LC7/MglB family)
MSCFSCSTSAVAERDVIDLMKDKLQALMDLYSNAAYPSIVNKEGMLVSSLLNEDKLGIDLTSTISALQTAAKQFSTILKLSGCPYLLISGDTQIFSMYSLHAEYVLVFFKSKQNLDDTLDTGDAAVRAKVKEIVDDLNQILKTALEEGAS